jgi:hypothetical protein
LDNLDFILFSSSIVFNEVVFSKKVGVQVKEVDTEQTMTDTLELAEDALEPMRRGADRKTWHK